MFKLTVLSLSANVHKQATILQGFIHAPFPLFIAHVCHLLPIHCQNLIPDLQVAHLCWTVYKNAHFHDSEKWLKIIKSLPLSFIEAERYVAFLNFHPPTTKQILPIYFGDTCNIYSIGITNQIATDRSWAVIHGCEGNRFHCQWLDMLNPIIKSSLALDILVEILNSINFILFNKL